MHTLPPRDAPSRDGQSEPVTLPAHGTEPGPPDTTGAERRAFTLAVVLLAGACLVALSWHVSVAYDIWWQLANGERIINTGTLVTTDSFTFTIAGKPYLDKYWLFEIVTFLIHDAWGWSGLTLLRTLMVLGCAVALLWSVRSRPRWLLMLLLVPALVLIDLRIGLRAHWLSFIIWPIYLRLAHRAFSPGARGWRSLVPLWVAQIIWTNLHSELLWGPVICGVMAAEAALRDLRATRRLTALVRPAVATAGAVVACLINPFGIALPLGLIREAGLVGIDTTSAEWLGLATFAQPLTWLAWGIFLLLVGLSFVRARGPLRVSRLVLMLLFAGLGLRSIRFLGNMVLLGIFVAMENRGGGAPEASPETDQASKPAGSGSGLPAPSWTWLDRVSHLTAAVLLIALLWGVCTDRFYHWQAELKRFGPGLLTSEMPVAASSFLEINSLGGNFLSLWSDADYLIWGNRPDIKVASDGRTAPFPRELTLSLRRIFEGDASELAAFESRYAVDGAVVAWHRRALLGTLAEEPSWKLVFIGPYATVWMKRASLVAQGDANMLAVDAKRFLVLDPDTAFAEESWLAYPALLHRRLLIFDAIGRTDLVRATAAAWKAYDPADPVLLELLGGAKPGSSIEPMNEP